MAHIFELVNQLFAQVVPVADFLWDFPTNIDAYANIPILGQLSIAFLLLLGGSLYFTLRFGFVQVKEFKTGIRLLTSKQQAKVGTSQLAAFLVSMGGRVGAAAVFVLLANFLQISSRQLLHAWSALQRTA